PNPALRSDRAGPAPARRAVGVLLLLLQPLRGLVRVLDREPDPARGGLLRREEPPAARLRPVPAAGFPGRVRGQPGRQGNPRPRRAEAVRRLEGAGVAGRAGTRPGAAADSSRSAVRLRRRGPGG